MSDADYIIVARIVAEDATGGAADAAGRRLQRVEAQAVRTGNTIGSTFTRMFAMIGGVYGIGRIVQGVVSLQSSMQDAQMGIAGLFTAIDHTPITRSIGIARGALKDLRKDAAKGVGEFNDYLEGFQTIFAPARQAGANNTQIRDLNKNAIAAGFALHGKEGATNMVFDVQQALGGTAGVRSTRQLNILLNSIGVSTTQLNAAKPEKRLELINKALATMAPGAEAMGKTWTAQWDTFKDNLKSVVLTISQPLFDRWSDRLANVNKWLSANSDRLRDIVEGYGYRLLAQWDELIKRAGTYAAIVAGAKVASSIGAVPGVAGGAGAIAGTVGLATGALLFGAVVAAFLALKGAIVEFPESLDFMRASLQEGRVAFAKLGESIDYATQKGSALNLIGKTLWSGLGGLVFVFDTIVRAVGVTIASLSLWANMIVQVGQIIGAVARGDWRAALGGQNELKKTLMGGLKTVYDVGWGSASGAGFSAGDAMRAARGADASGIHHRTDLPDGKRAPNNIFTGPINITAKTEINQDPTSVQYMIKDVLERLNRHAKQAASGAPIPSR